MRLAVLAPLVLLCCAGAQVTCGDCNLDGGVSVVDALLGARHAVGLIALSAESFRQCDANGSGTIDAIDVLLIAQEALGVAAALGCVPDREWQLRTPATSPPARRMGMLAFDPVRGNCVLFGGAFPGLRDDTWTWDGASWVERLVAMPPPYRQSAMTWDPLTSSVLLLAYVGGTCPVHDQTWSWDGSSWQQLHPSAEPPARTDGRLVYEGHRGVITLFGGDVTCRGILNDQWEWDGVTWMEIFPAVRPTGRFIHGMVYCTNRQTTLLFGGATDYPIVGPQAFNDETWEWDGSTWAELAPAHSPSPRWGHSMTYDEATGNVVLYGGSSPLAGAWQDDTWIWDGADWWPAPAAMSPSPGRFDHAATYDRARDKHVIFGGSVPPFGDSTDETWEY